MVQTEFHYVCNEITKFNNVPKAKTQPWAKKCINDSDHQGISLKNEPTNQTNIDKAMTTTKKGLPHTFPSVQCRAQAQPARRLQHTESSSNHPEIASLLVEEKSCLLHSFRPLVDLLLQTFL
jgi:hypothetical protein